MSEKTTHGARWVRAALQVNPYEYQGKSAPSATYNTEADYNKALLDECEVQGIELSAVTDHWKVDSALQLIRDAADRGIVALPSFEANSDEGIHILVISEAGTSAATINAAIGMCGVAPGCANGTTGASFTDILEKMTAQGALVIPAHVNVPNSGLLTGRAGRPARHEDQAPGSSCTRHHAEPTRWYRSGCDPQRHQALRQGSPACRDPC